MADRALTIKIVGDSKAFRRAAKDAISALDDTQTSGQRLATEMDRMSRAMEQDLRDAAAATEVLENALGQDTVDALRSVGRNVQDMVAEWRQAGVTYDEIRADADLLADTLRRSVEVGRELGTIAAPAGQAETAVKNLGDTADVTRTRIDDVRDSGDQSRSVLANMVGNSAQDLGELGGVAGTAGVAIGQLAEYAADGNIKLAGLAKIVGPMALLTAGVAGVSWAMGKLREDTEKATAAAEGMLAVQEALRDGKFEDAATKLQEEWGGTIKELEQYGFTTEEVIGHLTGQRDITEELDATVASYRRTLGDDLVMQEKYDQQVDRLRENLALATDAFREQGEQLDITAERTSAITDALVELDEAGSPAVDDNRAAIQQWHDEMRRAEQRTRDLDEAYKTLTGQLDQREAWLNLEAQVQDFAAAMYGGELSTREQEQALIDIQQELIEYLAGLEDVPAQTQTQILALIEQGSIGAATAQLDALARTRTAEFRILVEQVTSAEIKQMENRLGRDINGNGVIGRAAGGPVFPGEVYAVGDNPDGSWNRTTELFVPGTTGRIYDASDSRRLLGGGGTTIVNVTVPPGTTDPVAFGRMAGEAILAAARIDGPTFATAR